MKKYDKIVIGAGIYGLYTALYCAEKGDNVLVLEGDTKPFSRATYINQARVHQGYHYPRSLSTAKKSANYFDRFNKDFSSCINNSFAQVYATSKQFSWTSGEQFKQFCVSANIPCKDLLVDDYFNSDTCDSAFLVEENTYDADLLCKSLLQKIKKTKKVKIEYNTLATSISKNEDSFFIKTKNEKTYKTNYLVNSSYASTNQILDMLGYEKFKIKYELCEIILGKANKELANYGFTVMDGPFFSIMPFGRTGYHSLTSVTFTPHETCYEDLPKFECQKKSKGYCNEKHLGNCNNCIAKPKTSYDYMNALMKKYLKEKYHFKYEKSLFSIKPILLSSEIDDSRPTIVKKFSNNPTFISVLSGKINTIYDLEEVLNEK